MATVKKCKCLQFTKKTGKAEKTGKVFQHCAVHHLKLLTSLIYPLVLHNAPHKSADSINTLAVVLHTVLNKPDNFNILSLRFLLPKTNTKRYKASFLRSALSVFNENYKSLTLCACATGPTEDDDFRREDGGMHVPNDFI